MQLMANNIMVKKINRNRVFRFINSVEKTSMPGIVIALGMSGPTVLQIVKELTKLKVIEEVGEFQSTGGRKAKAISTVKDFCYAAGVDITRNHISILLINMAEEIQKYIRIRKPFVLEENYFVEINELLDNFIRDCKIPKNKVIGVGMSVPGIINREGTKIAFSHMLGIKDVECKQFLHHISYPGVILNDANAAALAECARDCPTENMVYLFLSNSVGGALVLCQRADGLPNYKESIFGRLYIGDSGNSGEFGHMTIHQQGRQCYCGKKGCLDAYCSALRLTDLTNGDLNEFFQELGKGNQRFEEVWSQYLDNLAIAVDNLRMCFDCEVVLGGYVGSYMEPYIERFRQMVSESNIFGYTGDYVKVCKYRVESSALGAATYLIEKYIDSI